jgi:hypothetical protein
MDTLRGVAGRRLPRAAGSPVASAPTTVTKPRVTADSSSVLVMREEGRSSFAVNGACLLTVLVEERLRGPLRTA